MTVKAMGSFQANRFISLESHLAKFIAICHIDFVISYFQSQHMHKVIVAICQLGFNSYCVQVEIFS